MTDLHRHLWLSIYFAPLYILGISSLQRKAENASEKKHASLISGKRAPATRRIEKPTS